MMSADTSASSIIMIASNGVVQSRLVGVALNHISATIKFIVMDNCAPTPGISRNATSSLGLETTRPDVDDDETVTVEQPEPNAGPWAYVL